MWARVATWQVSLREPWPLHWGASKGQRWQILSPELTWGQASPPVLLGGAGRCEPGNCKPGSSMRKGAEGEPYCSAMHWFPLVSLLSVRCPIPTLSQTQCLQTLIQLSRVKLLSSAGKEGWSPCSEGQGGRFEGLMLCKHSFQPNPESTF